MIIHFERNPPNTNKVNRSLEYTYTETFLTFMDTLKRKKTVGLLKFTFLFLLNVPFLRRGRVKVKGGGTDD